jgi:membrane-associated protease RseP (regulator of RpoE activity)
MPGRRLTATSDATGAFELRGLLPGDRADLDVRVLGDERLIMEHDEIAVPASGPAVLDVGVFRLMRGEAGWRDRMEERGTLGFRPGVRDRALTVAEVRPGTPAERAGLRPGDVIVGVDGRDVRALGPGAVGVLSARKPGASVTLTVQAPGGEPRPVTLTALPYPR